VSYINGQPQQILAMNEFSEKLIDQLRISVDLRRVPMSEMERNSMQDLNIKTLQVQTTVLKHC